MDSSTAWLREARWGLFTHYLAHTASMQISEEMTAAQWNKKVNRFDVERFAAQLAELRAPYFFITIGQRTGYYCSPNQAYERLFGPSGGTLTNRDLVAELAAALVPRGVKMCVYLPAVGRREPPERQEAWREVIAEWSQRWGAGISAWWIDGNFGSDDVAFREYTNAFKSGNPEALITYNTGPLGMNRDPKEPATEHEDYLAGEVNWRLPVSGARLWDGKKPLLGNQWARTRGECPPRCTFSTVYPPNGPVHFCVRVQDWRGISSGRQREPESAPDAQVTFQRWSPSLRKRISTHPLVFVKSRKEVLSRTGHQR